MIKNILLKGFEFLKKRFMSFILITLKVIAFISFAILSSFIWIPKTTWTSGLIIYDNLIKFIFKEYVKRSQEQDK